MEKDRRVYIQERLAAMKKHREETQWMRDLALTRSWLKENGTPVYTCGECGRFVATSPCLCHQ